MLYGIHVRSLARSLARWRWVCSARLAWDSSGIVWSDGCQLTCFRLHRDLGLLTSGWVWKHSHRGVSVLTQASIRSTLLVERSVLAPSSGFLAERSVLTPSSGFLAERSVLAPSSGFLAEQSVLAPSSGFISLLHPGRPFVASGLAYFSIRGLLAGLTCRRAFSCPCSSLLRPRLGVSWGREIESHRILFGSALRLPISLITKPSLSFFIRTFVHCPAEHGLFQLGTVRP